MIHVCSTELAKLSSVATLAQVDAFTMSDVFDWAKELRHLVHRQSEPLIVLSPCAGIDGPCRSLSALGIDWQSAGTYDSNIALHSVLADLTGGHDVHCGSQSGDV